MVGWNPAKKALSYNSATPFISLEVRLSPYDGITPALLKLATVVQKKDIMEAAGLALLRHTRHTLQKPPSAPFQAIAFCFNDPMLSLGRKRAKAVGPVSVTANPAAPA